jgi:hypothetical protein
VGVVPEEQQIVALWQKPERGGLVQQANLRGHGIMESWSLEGSQPTTTKGLDEAELSLVITRQLGEPRSREVGSLQGV